MLQLISGEDFHAVLKVVLSLPAVLIADIPPLTDLVHLLFSLLPMANESYYLVLILILHNIWYCWLLYITAYKVPK